MYAYKRAVGINQLYPQGEELVDVGAVPTRDIATNYRSMTIVIFDGLYNREVALNLEDYRNEFKTFTGTLIEWLASKKTVTLKTSNALPGDEYRFVTCHDIQYRWFSLLPGNAHMGAEKQDRLSVGEAPDIRVIKTDRTAVDYEALIKRSLWTVNGHLTRGVTDGKCVYLLNAGRHYHVNDNIHVTNLNFNTVSTLNTYGIQEADIEFENTDGCIFLHVRCPVDLIGKTVWMSIGGRLYLADVVQMVSGRMLVIRTEKVDWFTKLFDSRDLIDLSTVFEPGSDAVEKDFFTRKSFWVSLLTDPSSFLIVLDNPNLQVTLKPISTYRYPFTYHTEEKRNIPLMLSNGLLPKFFTRKITNRRLRDIDIGTQKRYVNKTTGTGNGGELYHGAQSRFDPSVLNKGYLLYIRSVLQKD